MLTGYLDKDGVLKQTGHGLKNYGKQMQLEKAVQECMLAGSGSMAINHVGAEN